MTPVVCLRVMLSSKGVPTTLRMPAVELGGDDEPGQRVGQAAAVENGAVFQAFEVKAGIRRGVDMGISVEACGWFLQLLRRV